MSKLVRIFTIVLVFSHVDLFAVAPYIQSILSDGQIIWSEGHMNFLTLRPGQQITLRGRNFGKGPEVDFSKVVVGKNRALGRDLRMYKGAVDLRNQLFYEKNQIFDKWDKDILSWTENEITFLVPKTATSGELIIQIQSRIGRIPSLKNPNQDFIVFDPFTERLRDFNDHKSSTVDLVSAPELSNAVPVRINTPEFASLVEKGEAIFWSYEYNIGLVHHIKGLDWGKIVYKRAVDPITGKKANPEELFGAIPLLKGEVPEQVLERVDFENYPNPMPLRPLLRPPVLSGWTKPTPYIGLIYSQAITPVTQVKGSWIGFSCTFCHAQRITYEAEPGRFVTKVFPGLPNQNWSMKWSILGDLEGIKGSEPGPDGRSAHVDKSRLLYAVPNGTGETSMIRGSGEETIFRNDHLFSPIAVPIITRHTPVRRALSHTELIEGFEGSYIHSQEPDGAIGAMRSDALQQLTAYMTTLDQDDGLLTNLGLFRWLRENGLSNEVDGVSEGAFLQAGQNAYPRLQQRIASGKASFDNYCLRCHQNNFGTWSDENMLPFDQVGSYFSPTIFHLKNQSIRTAIIRNLYWVEKRGLLHDGHVRNLKDLVNPDRCREGTELYQRMYTLNKDTFHISKGNEAQELATRRHAYFVDVSWDKSSLYWDYQKMRREFGVRELKTTNAVPLPAAPHPWCASNLSEVDDLVLYLLTL